MKISRKDGSILIELEMQKIVRENLQLRHFAMKRDAALALMEKLEESYKVELLREMAWILL